MPRVCTAGTPYIKKQFLKLTREAGYPTWQESLNALILASREIELGEISDPGDKSARICVDEEEIKETLEVLTSSDVSSSKIIQTLMTMVVEGKIVLGRKK